MTGWDGQERRSRERLETDFAKAKAAMERAQAHSQLEKLHSERLKWPPLVIAGARVARKRAVFVAIALAAVALAVVMVATVLLPSEKDQQAGDPRQDENRLYVLANGARVDQGIPVLSREPALETEAQRWAKVMANDKNLRHRANLRDGAPSNAGTMGENVAYNTNVEDMHARLLKSPGHRANILNKRFTYVGMGAAYDDQGFLWVTQIFMEAKSATVVVTTAVVTPPTTAAATGTSPTTRPC